MKRNQSSVVFFHRICGVGTTPKTPQRMPKTAMKTRTRAESGRGVDQARLAPMAQPDGAVFCTIGAKPAGFFDCQVKRVLRCGGFGH